MAGGLTDAVKAIRELLGLAGDLRKGGEWVIDIYQGRQSKAAARNLETLRFSKAGSKAHLEKIIAGTDTPADIEAIGAQMAVSAEEVEEAISRLHKYRDVIREKYGMEAVEALESLLYGPSGKRMIRGTLNELVEEGRRASPDRQHIANMARQASDLIEMLNVGLRKLHDRLLFEKKD
jgi:hypothetical protein